MQKYERLVSRETGVPHQWKSKTIKFGIKQVDKGKISRRRTTTTTTIHLFAN